MFKEIFFWYSLKKPKIKTAILIIIKANSEPIIKNISENKIQINTDIKNLNWFVKFINLDKKIINIIDEIEVKK